MGMFDKKSLVDSLASKISRKPKDEPKDEPEMDGTDEDTGSEDLEAIAEKMLQAIDEKDPSALADALKGAFKLC